MWVYFNWRLCVHIYYTKVTVPRIFTKETGRVELLSSHRLAKIILRAQDLKESFADIALETAETFPDRPLPWRGYRSKIGSPEGVQVMDILRFLHPDVYNLLRW